MFRDLQIVLCAMRDLQLWHLSCTCVICRLIRSGCSICRWCCSCSAKFAFPIVRSAVCVLLVVQSANCALCVVRSADCALCIVRYADCKVRYACMFCDLQIARQSADFAALLSIRRLHCVIRRLCNFTHHAEHI